MSVGWNPWHGCRKVSEGCRNCYVYRQDAAWGADGAEVRLTGAYNLPVRRDRTGRFKVAAGETVYTCFTSDFFLDAADGWRAAAWDMIRLRSDCRFFMITKRPERIAETLPDDWGDGWDHVAVACTVENGEMAAQRLPVYMSLPLKHRIIVCAPLLERIDLRPYLTADTEEVSVGGESGAQARVCDYDWVLDIRSQCVERGIPFLYHQTGARLRKDGRIYRIARCFQHEQARRAGIDYMIERSKL